MLRHVYMTPSTVRISDGYGAANGVETDVIFNLATERRDFIGRKILTVAANGDVKTHTFGGMLNSINEVAVEQNVHVISTAATWMAEVR